MKKPAISLEALEPFFEKIEKLTQVQRILIYVGSYLVIIGAFVYFLILPKFQQIDELSATLENLEQQIIVARAKASKLEQFRKDYAAAQDTFKIVKKSLPEEKDIPKLLESVSLSGQESGLEFLLFEPKSEQKKEFYSLLPVSIRVKGSFSSVIDFFNRVSRLNRIVHIRDVKINPDKKSNNITTECRANTFRFLETKGNTEEKKK
jgi:type IV pilus assembly protein PilO